MLDLVTYRNEARYVYRDKWAAVLRAWRVEFTLGCGLGAIVEIYKGDYFFEL